MTSPHPNELSPRKRILWLLAGYGIYLLAGPGILLPGGTPLGALGLVFWALAASRPGPWKKRIEWVIGGAALTTQTAWMGLVFWFALPWLFVGFGCWSVWGGWWMKRLAARVPLALATPVAWIGFESLLAWTPPPIGLSWLRLGHYLADFPVLAGSGRVWGVMGLGFVLASLAGLLADLVRKKSSSIGRLTWVAGLAPGFLAAGFTALFQAPETEPGPHLLLVQPAIEQVRKQSSGRPEDLFADSLKLTEEGLEEMKAQGLAPPDLVCWGETMLPVLLCEEGLAKSINSLQIDPWSPMAQIPSEDLVRVVERTAETESAILGNFFGGSRRSGRAFEGLFTEGTAFLAGVELLKGSEGRLRRANAMVLWKDNGRLAAGFKQHLAPGGETMVGLEAFEVVRDVIFEVAGYLPDLLPGEETTVIELPSATGGESWSFGATICFDNAFTDVYAAPLRRRDVDFHLIVSNEAWYEASQEFDQMIAMSRLHALCTGRSFVRVANSGVSCAIGADGRELARLRVGDRDRAVRGTLAVQVPVPVADQENQRTPFIWLQPWLLPFGASLPLLLGFLLLRRRQNSVRDNRNPDA